MIEYILKNKINYIYNTNNKINGFETTYNKHYC